MIRLIKRPCRPRIKSIKPNMALKPTSFPTRLERKKRKRIAKDDLRDRPIALQLELMSKRAKGKNNVRVLRKTTLRLLVRTVIKKDITPLIVQNLPR